MSGNGSQVNPLIGSCSMHNTLRRPHSSSGGLNTTLDDDVFFEDHSDAPNSARPLLSESRQFYLQNFPQFPISGKLLYDFMVHQKSLHLKKMLSTINLSQLHYSNINKFIINPNLEKNTVTDGKDPMDSSSSSRSQQQQQSCRQQQPFSESVFRTNIESTFRFGDQTRNKRRTRSSSTATR